MKIARQSAPSVISLYGGAKAAGLWGESKYASHDATKTWSDGGFSDKLAQDVRQSVSQAISENARDAVVENLKDGSFELATHGGRVHVVFDVSLSDQIPLKVHVPLGEMLMQAIEDSQSPDAGTSGGDFRQALTATLTEVAEGLKRLHNVATAAVYDEPELDVIPRRRKPATAAGSIAEPDMMAALTGRGLR